MNLSDLDNVIDSRDIITYIEEFEAAHEETIDAIALYPDDATLTKSILALSSIDEDDYNDYKEAKRVDRECSVGDWTYGTSLIRDDYFEGYAEQLCKDIGDMPEDISNYIVIDWAATAKNIQQDYSAVDVSGTTYWYRS